MGDAAEHPKQPTQHHLAIDRRVEVRSSFEGGWCPGFEIAEIVLAPDGLSGYRLRRLSDGTALPVVFPAEDVIPAGH
jgi:hypothetical protein